jgi:ATP-binding cassette subfamily B protein
MEQEQQHNQNEASDQQSGNETKSAQKDQNTQQKHQVRISRITEFLLSRLKPYWRMLLVIFLATTVSEVLMTYSTLVIRQFIDTLTGANPSAQALIEIVMTLLLVSIGAWIGRRVQGFLEIQYAIRAIRKLLLEAYGYAQWHSYHFFTNTFAGALVKKINRLVDGFMGISDTIIYEMYPTLIRVILTLTFIAQIHVTLTWVLAGWIVLFVGVNYVLINVRKKYEDIANEEDSRIGGEVADVVTNFFNVITFGTYRRELMRLTNVTHDWEKAQLKSWTISVVLDAVQGLLMIGIEFVLMYIGVMLWQEGQLTVGDFVMLQTLLLLLFTRLWDFGRQIRNMSEGFSKATEMVEIMDTPHEVRDHDQAGQLTVTDGAISIRNLTFAYPNGKEVFTDFSLDIPGKRKVALVSRSGSGKSTLIKLILRLYNIPEDTILIDAQDIMTVTQESLRQQISFVAQEPVLFHRTLAENIAYGRPDATMDEIIEAAKVAHAHEFIEKLEQGYQTLVGERGIKLSGGERQRVAIARAVLEDSSILILDEATSSLDSESERLIQDSLEQLMQNKTVIVIAHRLSTISMMDEIVVIEDGRIKERGSHSKLIADPDSAYRRLWDIQAGGFTDDTHQ